MDYRFFRRTDTFVVQFVQYFICSLLWSVLIMNQWFRFVVSKCAIASTLHSLIVVYIRIQDKWVLNEYKWIFFFLMRYETLRFVFFITFPIVISVNINYSTYKELHLSQYKDRKPDEKRVHFDWIINR
jgi:hypothetical protein